MTGRVKSARLKLNDFDEAHYMSDDPPPGGKALIKAGYPKQKAVAVQRLPITTTENRS